jgi:signal transduction histidine kinase
MATVEANQPVVGVEARMAPREGSRVRWLAPEPFDWALSALYISVIATYALRVVIGDTPFSWVELIVLIVASLALIGVDRWEYWRYQIIPPPRIALLLLVMRFALIEAINLVDKHGAAPFLYLILPFIAALSLGTRAGWVVGGLIWLRFLLHMGSPTDVGQLQPHTLENVLVLPAGIAFVLAMASVVNAERAGRVRTERLLGALESSHARLTDYASQVEELTITAERSRLAREIHDSLGHYLTAINVQLRKATAFRDKDPQQADQAVRESTRLAHEALEDVRRSVGWLRTSNRPLSLDRALQELVGPFHGEGLQISVAVDGSEEGFARSTLLAIYRAAQEGLTNVQRHAQARRVELTLCFGPDDVLLTLADDGAGFDPELLAGLPAGRADRYGLQGVRERMELVGGTLEIASRPGGGTTITLRAPKEPPGERVRELARTDPEVPPTGALRHWLKCDDEERRDD